MKFIIDDLVPKDTILMIPDNFRIHEITCIEPTKNGYTYTSKLYPYYIKKIENKEKEEK